MSMYAYPLFNPNCKVTFGGAEVQLFNLATHLSFYPQFDVWFLVRDFGQKDLERYGCITVKKIFDMTGSIPGIRGIQYLASFFKTLHKVNADTFIQRAAGVETGLTALFCRITGKKFVYMTASSIDVDGTYVKNNPFWGLFYLAGIKMAHLIVTQNVQHKNELFKRYKLKSVVIRNSFIVPDKKPKPNNKSYILWVGSAQPLKQPEIFIQMAEMFPKYKFVMIMPKHNMPLWNKIKGRAQVISNLKFIDFVPLNKIHKYYENAKIFVNTSTFEGFPNTFVQSTAGATPIVSLTVNPDNFITDYGCGFWCKSQINNLIDNIKTLMTNKIIWEKMSQNSYKYAIHNHDIRLNTEKLVSNIYLEQPVYFHTLNGNSASTSLKQSLRLSKNSKSAS